MNQLLDFIEKHKYGIIATLIVHVGLFIYFQVTTYEELVVYEPWSFRGKNIEAPDNIILPEEIIFDGEVLFEDFELEDVSSAVSRSGDTRESSSDINERYTSYEGDAYQNIKEFESQVIQQLQEGRKEDQTDNTSNFDAIQNDNKRDEATEQTSTNQLGSEKRFSGETMVSFELDNRFPLNNNDWHVRNPGYTCGNVEGKVVVTIRVNNNGDVVSAKYIPEESTNANYCMIRQAEKYALLSRFNYSSNAPRTQDGKISYLFVYRR